MNCNVVREQMMELAPGALLDSKPDAAAHVQQCGECAKVWNALKSTMAVLDEWQSPEVSPYFETRFHARLAEVKAEETRTPSGVFGWLKKLKRPMFGMPALAGVLALAVAVGLGVANYKSTSVTVVPKQTNASINVGNSSAVNDLNSLDNQELLSDMDVLDDVGPNDNPAQKPAQDSSDL